MHVSRAHHSAHSARRVHLEQRHGKGGESDEAVTRSRSRRHAAKMHGRHDHGLRETSPNEPSLGYRKSESTILRIRTQEGDVVHLKFKNRVSAEIQTADAQDGDTDATEQTLETRSSSTLSIKIRGHLNADELAAIQDTVDQAMALADDFFAGNVQEAFESVAAFGIDGEQLARVQLRLRSKERLTYSPSDVGRLPAPVENPALPGPAPDTPEPSGADNAASGSVEPSAKQPADAPQTEAPHSDGQAEDAAPVDPFFALRAAGDFLSRLLDTLGAHDGEQAAGSIELSLKIRIVRSTIVALAEGAAEEAPLPELVPDTLDALAAQEQQPVDQLA